MTYIINSDPGHARSEQQMDKNLERFFASSSKSTDERIKYKAFCVTRKRNKKSVTT